MNIHISRMAAAVAACVVSVFTVLSQTAVMALPGVSVACVREKPNHAAELGTQVIMGTPVKIIEKQVGWYAVETPEGYHGYVIANSLVPLSADNFERWKKMARVVVTAIDGTFIYSIPETSMLNRVSDVVNGSILCIDGDSAVKAEGFTAVKLPDGRRGFIPAADVMPLAAWASRPCSMTDAISFAMSMMGSPYLWGGTSSKSADCSGLTKISYLSQGIILPRNASQQAEIGETIPYDNIALFKAGDLLFFGNARNRRVNHVGIYIGNGRFIHCSGRVRINSLEQSASDYIALSLLEVRRLDHNTLHRLALKNHPWFF